MLNVLHVIHDGIFFDSLITLFDSIKCNNTYILVNSSKEYNFNCIKNTERILILENNSSEYRMVVEKKYDLVIIHYLLGKEKIILDCSNSTNFLWISWGGDLYSLVNYPLFQQKTQKTIKIIKKRKEKVDISLLLNKKFVKRSIKKIIRIILKYAPSEKKIQKEAIKKINYCATMIPIEFKYTAKIKNFNARQVYFNYSYNNLSSYNTVITGKNILIGNSRTWENNHLEIFNRLYSENITENSIICPLSYGDSLDDFSIVLQTGKELFNEKFLPIFEYMDFSDYNKILATCSVAIFNHNRQQAMGNVIIMLWQGSKVYLSERNPMYSFYKDLGITIFSIENDLNKIHINEELRGEDILINRKILLEQYSEESFLQKINTLFETIFGKTPGTYRL